MKLQNITKPRKDLMGTFVLLMTLCGGHSMPCVAQWGLNVAKLERARVLKAANDFLKEAPVTITASLSPRSAGGRHDYFSEGDYWWPDPQNPDGPYIQRDGMSNPNNFVDHRRYLIRMSIQMPACGCMAVDAGQTLCKSCSETPASLVHR